MGSQPSETTIAELRRDLADLATETERLAGRVREISDRLDLEVEGGFDGPKN